MNGRALGVLLALGCAAACAAACNQADPIDDEMVDPVPEHDAGSAGSGGDDPDAGVGAGSGGEGGSGEGGGGSMSALDHFPLSDGASWKYLHSSGAWMETVSVDALSTANRFSISSSPDVDGVASESTVELVDGDVLRVSEDTLIDGVLDQTVTYDPGFLRFSAAWADADTGFTERREYQRTEMKVDGTPKAPAERAHIYTVESLSEDVNVPAGSFRNCLRVHRARDYDVTDAMGATIAEEQEKRYWFCPGVGKVREENVMTGSTESLVEYDL